MAKIVLGLAASHGPMLGVPPQRWEQVFRGGDRRNPLLYFRKQLYTYDELLEVRAGERLEQFLTEEEKARRHGACMVAAEKLREVYRQNKPDVLVIIGNDHRESFTDLTPPFGVYLTESVENGPTHDGAGDLFYTPGRWMRHECDSELALHLLQSVRADDFDLATITQTLRRDDADGRRIVPHAFGFVYHWLFHGEAPPQTVLVHINTFYQPNQPPMKRVLKFAQSLSKAIGAWDSSKTVGIMASGGLSHFIVDEEVDRFVIDALKDDDVDRLAELDEMIYQSGTSEVKNWVPVAVAMKALGAKMNLIDYVPCYRSPAGNGHGIAFAHWQPGV